MVAVRSSSKRSWVVGAGVGFGVVALLGALACATEEAPEGTMAPDTVGAAADGNACQDSQPWAQGFQADHCTMADGGLPPIDPTLWPDVCTPQSSAGWTPTQTSFDQLSWRSLLALAWPADPDDPGQPDTGQSLGAQQDGAFLATVWESYKSSQDLFGPGGAALTAEDFGEAGPVPRGCSADGGRVLTMTSKVPLPAIRAVRAAGLLGAEAGAIGSIDQAFRGPLVDQDGKVVYYEIRINDVEYDAIVAAGAPTKSPDELNCTGQYETPECTPFTLPVGSIEVKAAWKQLTPEELASGTFFSRELQLAPEGGGGCTTVPMGLVGFHVARKTQHSLNVFGDKPQPSWAWSTFEHAGNVPPVGSAGEGRTWSFYDAACTPAVTAADCEQAAGTGDEPNPAPAFQCCPNLWRYPAGPPPAGASPDQITRLDEAPAATTTCNEVYARTPLEIWGNYSLVSTQWPKVSEGPPAPGTITPTYLRNTTLESYFTDWENGVQVNRSSCMGCHFGSQAVDMSYLFLPNAGTE